MDARAGLIVCFGLILTAAANAQDDEKELLQRGVVTNTGAASPGYTLISPFGSNSSFLVDVTGQVLNKWDSDYEPGLFPYLLPNGNLLRGIQLELPIRFEGGGMSGGLQEFTWDGELVWEYHLASQMFLHHHDIEPMPNGNILMVAWEGKSQEEAIAMGRIPLYAGERGMWPCFVIEIEPLPPYGARVVWEWHMWDHLIQDVDSDKPNYGPVFMNPGRLNINFDVPRADSESEDEGVTSEEAAELAALGYLAGGDPDNLTDEQERARERADWMHINGIDYNAELDQIVLSSWQMSEVFVIDHSTTTEEARGSAGGRSGRGGDILYRWGNPANYQMGEEEDRVLFHQHDAQWVPEGYPGAGNLTIFNNGRRRPEDEYSNVLEITPPLQDDGTYLIEEGLPYGPEEPTWEYGPTGEDEAKFYSSFISGAHRTENGNTLICDGPRGHVREVNPAGEIVWEYNVPFRELKTDEEISDRDFAMFRATRIPPDHPGLAGRDLTPLDPQPKTHAELLAAQPPAGVAATGWEPLFDDEIRLSKWVDVNVAGETFAIQENPDNDDETILFCTGKPTGLLRSERMYENFIIEFEYRHMNDPGNAGFFVWADPLPALGGPFTRGIEVQVCNLGNGSWFTSHGDIFPIWGAVMTPDPRFRISGSRSMPNEDAFHANETGEWNHFRITCVDGAITLEVNGNLVTAGSKCSPSKGYLCIESEGGEVHFRDMRIWELPSGSHAADEARTASEATTHRTLYTGIDLEGWEVKEGEWSSADWRLVSKAGAAVIEAELPEGTTTLFFDFKRAEKPEGAFLPFRIGEARFHSTGEQVGQWNRVTVNIGEGESTVQMGDQTHTLAHEGGAPGVLTLVNDGVATEFCSLFSAVEER